MRDSRKFIAAAPSVLLAGAGTGAAAPHAASVLASSRFDDGSFEYPVSTPAGFIEIVAGRSIDPWQVTVGSVDLMGARGPGERPRATSPWTSAVSPRGRYPIPSPRFPERSTR
ncbi:hypothetical protein FHX80_111645 [Streptomyces brevispora]|uniref:Uncharacterized protein n=1 Tax=Streptomyces brevispora TaxID=887462 RepID=A0A561UV37_9ACTN|nr:hypothetical protein FHX80_111645 [Streptomyces brevispora]